MLSSLVIDRIIRETVYNPKISKEEINEIAGIPHRGSRENKVLKPWIQENTYRVFGRNIRWQSVELHSMRGAKIRPDLIGTYSDGCPVIVEVKFKFDFPGDPKYLRRDREDRSIGQILQYAYAYMRKHPSTEQPRLFIVSIDFSPDVEYVCKFLCSKNIDIQHIAIEDILSR